MDGATRFYNVLMGNPIASSNNRMLLPSGNRNNSANEDENFFVKRGKSLENAFGTTGAAIASGVKDLGENIATNELRKERRNNMNDIAKKYGYDSWDAWQDDYANAHETNDTEKIARMEPQLQEFQAQANSNAAKTNKKSEDYNDYRQNNYVSKKINQDQGKFAGSAINTLSTMTDVLLPTAGVALNAVQGGVEGLADELEQNGFENFSGERAAQNAIAGAASGLVTGGLNKGLNKQLAKTGGNLFKGGNAITRGLNNLGANTAAGRIGSTIATGVGRGALSGAAGGATGAGISAAMNGQDVLGSALQGAVQGAKQGAIAGGVMAGANMAASKTPGVGDMMQKINQAGEDWQNSGKNFDERWENTRAQDTWGNRLLDNGVETANAVKSGFQDVGEGLSILAQRGAEKLPGVADALSESPLGNVGMGVKNVAADQANLPDDIRGLKINDNMSGIPEAELGGKAVDTESPETQVYRTMSQTTEQPKDTRWDTLSQEFGFKDYADATKQFKQANPNMEASAQNIMDWVDKGSPSNKKAFTEAPTGKQIKSKRAIVEEIMGQFNATDKPTTRQTRPSETFYNLYEKMGLSDGDQIRQAIKYAEPGELVPTIIREAAGQAGVVDLTDAQKLVSDLRLNKRQNYKKTLDVLEDIIDSTPSTISGGKNGVDALELQRAIEGMASDAMGTSGEYHVGNNVLDQTTAKNLLRISNSIGENLDKVAAEKGAVEFAKNKYAAELEQMKNSNTNPKWQNMVEKKIKGATTIKDLRSSIRDLTRASIFIKNGDENFATFGGRVAKNTAIPTSRAGITNKIVNAAYEKVNEIPVVRNMRLKRYEKALNTNASTPEAETNGVATPTPDMRLSNTGGDNTTPMVAAENVSNTPLSQTLWNQIGRTEGLTNAEQARTANYLVNATQQAPQPQTLEQMAQVPGITSANNAVYNSMYGGGNTGAAQLTSNQVQNPTMQGQSMGGANTAPTGNSYFPTTGDYWTDVIGTAMTSAIDANDLDAFIALYSMYQDALSSVQKQASSNSSNSNQKLSTTQQRANAAMNSLERLSAMTPDVGYNLSGIPVIGNIATLGGNDYESEAKSLAQQIGYMVSGANIKEEEAENIGKAYVPQPFDNETTRKNKLQRAREIIGQYQNVYY